MKCQYLVSSHRLSNRRINRLLGIMKGVEDLMENFSPNKVHKYMKFNKKRAVGAKIKNFYGKLIQKKYKRNEN